MIKKSLFVLFGIVLASTSFAKDANRKIASDTIAKSWFSGTDQLTINDDGSATIQEACGSVTIAAGNWSLTLLSRIPKI